MITQSSTTTDTSTTSTDGGMGAVQRLRDRHQEQVVENWSAYRSLLDDLSKGIDVDPSETDLMLRMVTRSYDDLEADLSKLKERQRLYAQVAEEPAIQAALAEAESKHQEARAKYEAAVAKLSPPIAEAWDAIQAAQTRLLALQHVKAELIRGNDDPAIRSKLDRSSSERRELNDRRVALIHRIQAVESDRREVETELRKFEDFDVTKNIRVDEMLVRPQRRDHVSREKLKQIGDLLEQLRSEQSEVESRLSAVSQRIEELELAKLQP